METLKAASSSLRASKTALKAERKEQKDLVASLEKQFQKQKRLTDAKSKADVKIKLQEPQASELALRNELEAKMTVQPESKADVSTDVAERKSDPEKNQEKDRCGIANTFPSCVPLVPHFFPTCLPLVSHLSSTCLPLVSLLRPSCLLLVSHFFSACRPLFSTCLPLVPHLFPTAGSCWVSIFTHCVAVPPSSGMRRVPRTSKLCLPLCLPLCVSNFFLICHPPGTLEPCLLLCLPLVSKLVCHCVSHCVSHLVSQLVSHCMSHCVSEHFFL